MAKSKPEIYQIYGIFDFKQKSLIYVDVEFDNVELEFDVQGYDESQYAILEFELIVDTSIKLK